MVKIGDQMIENNSHSFDAIRAIQAESEFFVITCQLKMIPKLFLNEERELSPEMRAQRAINPNRIPRIKNYILCNPKEYIFSSLTASVDGRIKFMPAPHLGPNGKIGRLYIDKAARFLINDGQHRKKAIEVALKDRPILGREYISIVLYADKGLKRSQQMFADLNKNALKPPKSLNILYDHRDTFSQFVIKLANRIEIFRGRVNFEKTNIGRSSNKIFTLNAILDSTKKLLSSGKIRKINETESLIVENFWDTVAHTIPEWQLLIQGKIQPDILRTTFVHSNANCLNALGIAGRVIRETHPHDWLKKLGELRGIDWSRDNPIWEGRLIQGKWMVRTTAGIELGANTIIKGCGVELSDSRMEFERKI